MLERSSMQEYSSSFRIRTFFEIDPFWEFIFFSQKRIRDECYRQIANEEWSGFVKLEGILFLTLEKFYFWSLRRDGFFSIGKKILCSTFYFGEDNRGIFGGGKLFFLFLSWLKVNEILWFVGAGAFYRSQGDDYDIKLK